MKNLEEYFESSKGSGVLATADSSGKVDAAIYSRPHSVEERNCRSSAARLNNKAGTLMKLNAHVGLIVMPSRLMV